MWITIRAVVKSFVENMLSDGGRYVAVEHFLLTAVFLQDLVFLTYKPNNTFSKCVAGALI